MRAWIKYAGIALICDSNIQDAYKTHGELSSIYFDRADKLK